MALFNRETAATEEIIEIVGAPKAPLSDLYHLLLRAPWWFDLVGIASVYLLLNALFAVGYVLSGGIANAQPGSLRDAFFFSVQTLGTVGYGAMFPQSTAAQSLMTCESLVGIVFVALITGMLFAKFSVPRSRMQFAHTVALGVFDGAPTLMLRVGNERASRILEAVIRVVLLRTERTAEGTTFYRMYDLKLERDRSPALSRSWNVLHKITADSPLYGATPESTVKDEIELVVTVAGTDETSAQLMHGRYRYTADQFRWGARHADMLSELPSGLLRLDMRKFHDTTPTPPVDGFPYPR